MPLEHEHTEAAFKHDLKAELAAGKPKKQALAIAYSATGKDEGIRAAGVMYRCGDKILLLKRTNDGTWGFPAGKLESDETAELAARRESLEETGILPDNLTEIDHTNEEDVDFVTYLSNVGQTLSPKLNSEHSEYMWGDFDSLPDNLHPGVAATIKKYRGECAMDSAQQTDMNGFITIEANPISRSGIFPYLGKSIDSSAEPDRIYNVYRPESEINNSETLESMKLIPLIDEHVMVGIKKQGMMAPEDKGIQGSTGETVFFRDGILFATIKIFSQTLADMIKMGKKALSLGYQCKFIKESGISKDGQTYDYVQRFIRGNHLALVHEARCDVAVLDHNMAFDHFDLALSTEGVKTMAAESKNDTKEKDGDNKAPGAKDSDEHGEMTLQELHDLMKEHMPMLKKMNDMMDKHFGEKDEEHDEKTDPAMDKKAKDNADFKPTTEKDAVTGNGKGVTDEEEKEEKKAMDSAIKQLNTEVETLKKDGFKSVMKEVRQRDELAGQISHFVGTFDHAEMSKQEVAAYGVEKLGIKCEKGQEIAALTGFMHNRNPGRTVAFGMDGATGASGKDDLYEKTSKSMYN